MTSNISLQCIEISIITKINGKYCSSIKMNKISRGYVKMTKNMRNQSRFHANLLYFKATLMRVVNKNSVISKRKLKGLFQEMYYKATT